MYIVTWDYFYFNRRVTYEVYIVTWDYFYLYRRVTYAVYIVTWNYFYLYRRVTCALCLYYWSTTLLTWKDYPCLSSDWLLRQDSFSSITNR